MDIKNLLGKRIQEIRRSKNITQEYLAELIGIETVSLSNIERGKYYPTSENLNKIINILEIEPEDLKVILEEMKNDEETDCTAARRHPVPEHGCLRLQD